MTSTVREMRWQDIPGLVVVEAQVFGADAWAAPTWWSELAGRPRRSYVVAEDTAITGYAGLDHAGEVADVMTIAVAPERQGQGLGTRLLRDLMTTARAGGAAYLMLEVRADNAAAQHLYERHGFSVLRVRRRYYQPGDVDALIMRADLAGATT